MRVLQRTSIVETSPSCTTSHLDVLARQQVTECSPVVLPDRVEADAACRHVHAHSKRLCREQHLDQTPPEQHFNHFFDDRQQTTVVHPDTTLQHLAHPCNLRQFPVGALQPVDGLLDEDVGFRLFLRRVHVEGHDGISIRLATLLTKRKDDARL